MAHDRALGFLHGGRSEYLINTSLQRGGWAKTISNVSRFNGLPKKPLKRLICRMQAGATSLKRGVNEIGKSLQSNLLRFFQPA